MCDGRVCLQNNKIKEAFMKFILTAVSSCLLMLLAACAASTEGIPSVQGLDIPRYMGKWYEIARMPHSFERNMDYVTADYTLNEDNTVRVVNRGKRDGKFSQAEGIAKLKYKDAYPAAGEFRVSFFRPFYGDYRIIDLAPDYSHAVVTSGTMDYLWILSRTPQLPQERLSAILEQLRSRGFDIGRLEYPKQETAPCSSAK